MAHHVVLHVHMAPEEVFEQDHVIDQKYTPSKLKISIVEITVQFFICFLNSKTLSVLQGKLQLLGFKQSVLCSCLTATSASSQA